jgi:hypothetical protein
MEMERIKGYFRPNEMLADDEKEKRRDKNHRAAQLLITIHFCLNMADKCVLENQLCIQPLLWEKFPTHY